MKDLLFLFVDLLKTFHAQDQPLLLASSQLERNARGLENGAFVGHEKKSQSQTLFRPPQRFSNEIPLLLQRMGIVVVVSVFQIHLTQAASSRTGSSFSRPIQRPQDSQIKGATMRVQLNNNGCEINQPLFRYNPQKPVEAFEKVKIGFKVQFTIQLIPHHRGLFSSPEFEYLLRSDRNLIWDQSHSRDIDGVNFLLVADTQHTGKVNKRFEGGSESQSTGTTV